MQKILVVEDDEELLNGLEMILSKEGYQVLRTNQGEMGLDIAVPKRGSSTQQGTVPLQPHIQVVQQGLDRTDVQDTETRPAFGQHTRQNGEEGCFRFATGSRGKDDQVVTGENRRDDSLLKRPQFTPSQAVDNMVLQGRMQAIKMAHKSNSISSTSVAPIACRSTGLSSASLMVSA